MAARTTQAKKRRSPDRLPWRTLRRRKRDFTFWEHVDDFRSYALWGVAFFVAVSIFIFSYAGDTLIAYLLRPAPGGLVFLSVLGPFLFKMKIAFIGGAVVSLPLWLVLISRFVDVALPPHKRIFFYVLVAASFTLGVAAMALAYFYLVPISIKVLAGFAVPGTTLMLTAESYLSFFLLQLLVSFIVLEIPVVIVGLSYVRLLNPHKLSGKSRIIFTVLLIGLAIRLRPQMYSHSCSLRSRHLYCA